MDIGMESEAPSSKDNEIENKKPVQVAHTRTDSRMFQIQCVCMILFIFLFLVTLGALIAVIITYGLQNNKLVESEKSIGNFSRKKNNNTCGNVEETLNENSQSNSTTTLTTLNTTTTSLTTLPTTTTIKTTTTNIKCHPNATLINSTCECNLGFVGDGKKHCDECGLTFYKQNSRIVGGVEAVPHSWPSVAYILFRYKGDVYIPELKMTVLVRQSFRCMGTLIDRRTILTAAHCIMRKLSFNLGELNFEYDIRPTKYYPTVESMFKVYLGMHNRSVINSFDMGSGERYSVAKIKIHPDYDDIYKLNDIAILKLVREVDLNEFVQLTCLPQDSSSLGYLYPKANVNAYAVGWGSLNYSSESPINLRNVRLTVYNSSMCKRVAFEIDKNWNSQICAGEYEGGKDTCQGDSGGSLFVEDSELYEKKKYISAGIVSYGMGCADKYMPGVYTRISYYLDWIRANAL